MNSKSLNEIEQAILKTLVVGNKESMKRCVEALKPVFEKAYVAGKEYEQHQTGVTFEIYFKKYE